MSVKNAWPAGLKEQELYLPDSGLKLTINQDTEVISLSSCGENLVYLSMSDVKLLAGSCFPATASQDTSNINRTRVQEIETKFTPGPVERPRTDPALFSGSVLDSTYLENVIKCPTISN